MKKLTLGGLTAHLTGGSDGDGSGDGPVVVLMHGFGAPGTDLVPLAEELEGPAGTRFVFPMAPNSLDPGAPPLYAPRAWWLIDIQALQVASLTRNFADLAERKPDGIDAARGALEKFLGALEGELGVTSERCVLGGFSQGAMLATETVLRGSKRYGGLLVLSGTVLMRDDWTKLAPNLRGLPVLQSHGREDPILPFELAEELREVLANAGVDVDWVAFRGGHGIPRVVLDRASALLKKAFPASSL